MGKKHLSGSALTRLTKAAYWLQRLHQSPDDEPLFRRCRRWCAAHPANADAFERLETVWHAIGQLESPGMTRQTVRALPMERLLGRVDSQQGNALNPPLTRATAPPVKQRLPRAPRIYRPLA
jgi:ferric-dicitrate binding protein FerR (iron transport regulator)